jgi:hypothetical protein
LLDRISVYSERRGGAKTEVFIALNAVALPTEGLKIAKRVGPTLGERHDVVHLLRQPGDAPLTTMPVTVEHLPLDCVWQPTTLDSRATRAHANNSKGMADRNDKAHDELRGPVVDSRCVAALQRINAPYTSDCP